jgi:hypothetical protein
MLRTKYLRGFLKQLFDIKGESKGRVKLKVRVKVKVKGRVAVK